MGRAKLSMELIQKEKTRITTFKKRKQGLIRKMHEFTTLCDVPACMIIYGPKQETGGPSSEPEIWPQDREQVRRIIEGYKTRNKDSGNKSYGLHDFFSDRSRKIEEELTKLRQKNIKLKYLRGLESMERESEASLRDLVAILRNKAEYVQSRIDLLKRNKQGLMMDINMQMSCYYNNNNTNNNAHHARLAHDHNQSHVKMEVSNDNNNNNIYYPAIDHRQNSSMMMLLMNDINYSDHTYDQQQVFHEPMATGWAGPLDPSMICQSSGLMARYYGQAVPVPMPALPSVYHLHDQDGSDGSEYQMNFDNIGRYYG
ncbi:hypothetical protein OROMI_031588 [Orobanche minor]